MKKENFLLKWSHKKFSRLHLIVAVDSSMSKGGERLGEFQRFCKEVVSRRDIILCSGELNKGRATARCSDQTASSLEKLAPMHLYMEMITSHGGYRMTLECAGS